VGVLIDKISHLGAAEQKIFYRDLTARLLAVFGQDFYDDETDLQLDFHEWKNGDRKDYHTIVNEILSDLLPGGIKLTWRDLSRLSFKRWHICSMCGNPFIAVDTYNKTRICFLNDYKRYKAGTDGKEGVFFKSTEKGKSACFMAYKASKAKTP
jgi:hypothetical protein